MSENQPPSQSVPDPAAEADAREKAEARIEQKAEARRRNVPIIGMLSAFAGLLLIICTLFFTLIGVSYGTGDKCMGVALDKPELRDPEIVLYVPDEKLGLNGNFCISIRSSRYFASEWKEITGKRDTAIAAEAERRAARNQAVDDFKGKTSPTAAEQKAQDDKLAKFDSDIASANATVVKESGAVQAALKAVSTVKPASIFINDARTPTTFNMYVVDPKAGEGGWTWKTSL